ncbi:hypothetical protein BGW38_003037, partial [Lunasporangiospora selenospora]
MSQGFDHIFSATQQGAEAVIVYAQDNQHECASLLDHPTNTAIPILTLDQLTAAQLIDLLEKLESKAVAMATLAFIDPAEQTDETESWPIDTADNIQSEQIVVRDARAEDATCLEDMANIGPQNEEKEQQQVPHHEHHHHPTLIASLSETFSAAKFAARRIIVRFALEPVKRGYSQMTLLQDHGPSRTDPLVTDEMNLAEPKAEVKVEMKVDEEMVSTPFQPPSMATLPERDPVFGAEHGREYRRPDIFHPNTAAAAAAAFALESSGETEDIQVKVTLTATHPEATPTKDPKQLSRPPSTPAIALQRRSIPGSGRVHSALPKSERLVHRIYSMSPSKFVQDASLLIKDDSITGKLAMVLMSTVCGVGVGMFGALLFVVALKVRLFQTRRRGQNHQQSHGQGGGQGHHGHQQTREPGFKRVIPRNILESFGVQTVLHTSSTMTTTTALVKTTLLPKAIKVKLSYAEDVIEMEEGLDDLAARLNARRQRMRSRGNPLFLGQDSFQDQRDSEVPTEETELLADEDHDQRVPTAMDEGPWGAHFDGDEMEAVTNHRDTHPVLTTRPGSEATPTMEMDGAATSAMIATRRGSHRRIQP